MYNSRDKLVAYHRNYRFCKEDGYAVEDTSKTARIKTCAICGAPLYPRTVSYHERGNTK